MSKEFTKTSSLVPSLRERQRNEREDAILTVALELMSDIGYSTMTMDDLAAHAGISKPTLYAYFPSKEAVAVRAVVRCLAQGREFLDHLPEQLTAFERVEAVMRHLLTGKLIDRIAYLGNEKYTLIPALRANPGYQTEYAHLIERLVILFEEAKKDGIVKPELPTRIAVQSMISLLRDTEYIDLIDRGECEPHTAVDTLMSILLDGLRKKDTK